MQSISGIFNGLSKKSIRRPVVSTRIGWRRIKDDGVDFAVVGTSVVGGTDIVQGEFTAITQSDLFEYFEEDDRLISVSTDQELVEPLGGVFYGRSNVLLSNTDKRYTEGYDPTIGNYITRNRPVKVFMGFKDDNDSVQQLPILYGLTKDIEYQNKDKTVKLPIYDYLSHIDDFKLSAQRFISKRTDEIIQSILEEIGFVPEQFALDTGLNTIGFVWIGKDETAGTIIRKLCQSEGAYFFQDELGRIVFMNRENAINTDRLIIDKSDMVEYEENMSGKVYNAVTIKSYPRVVLAEQDIYVADNAIEVPTGVSSFFVTLTDPLGSLSTPISNTNWVANSARDGSGTDETADVAITFTDFVDTVKVNVNNTSGAVAYLTTFIIEGEPAVVEKVIEETAEDLTSQEEFGYLPLVVENDWITSATYASDLADSVILNYSPNNRETKISMPALPQLQLGDRAIIETSKLGGFNYEFDKLNTLPGSFSKVIYQDDSGNELIQEHLSSNSSVKLGASYYTKVGQSFLTLVNDDDIGNRFVYMRKVGNPEGGVVMKTYAHSGTFGSGGVPTGAVLQTSIVKDDIGTDYSACLFAFYFPDDLLATTEYFSVLEYDGGDANNYYEIQIDTTDAGDGNGAVYDGSWTAIGDLKHSFYDQYQHDVPDLSFDNGLVFTAVTSNYGSQELVYDTPLIFENAVLEFSASTWGDSTNQWGFYVYLYIDANNGLWFEVCSGDITVWAEDGGVNDDLFYEENTGQVEDNRSFRLIQAGGYIYVQSSKNGIDWITVGEISNPSWVGQEMTYKVLVEAYGSIPGALQRFVLRNLRYTGFEEKQIKRIQNRFSLSDGLIQTLYLR